MAGPVRIDPTCRQPMRLVHHRMGEAKRDREKRWRFQRKMKPQNHAGIHVDRDGQGRSAERAPRDRIDNRHIGLGMIDLNDVERAGRGERSGRGKVAVIRLVLPLPPGHEFCLILQIQPAAKAPDRGWGQAFRLAVGCNLAPEPGLGRFATGGIERLEMMSHDRFDRRLHWLHAWLWPRGIRQQRTGPRVAPELFRQAEDRRPADIQLPHRPSNVTFGELFRQFGKHSCAKLGFFPVLVRHGIIGHDLNDARMLCSLTNGDSHPYTVS